MATNKKPQVKLAPENKEKKQDLDKSIANLGVDLKLLQLEAAEIKGNLDTELERRIEDKATPNEATIVGLYLKLDQLATEAKNVGKRLRDVIKKRVEYFGNEDIPSDAEISALAEKQAKEKEAAKRKGKKDKE